ncbi:hypothetical protein AAF712_014925 [Marasmius tenuissimus]|uniref:Ubiquitin-like protease family profile domain-containing protein n=1 Tax=Marasmius tenuissimus TaxID=585030 RepID=A0ABR2ZB03_9AGAR|nr:hypothetical protein PM082_024862 [Marasmius tenuissimus]
MEIPSKFLKVLLRISNTFVSPDTSAIAVLNFHDKLLPPLGIDSSLNWPSSSDLDLFAATESPVVAESHAKALLPRHPMPSDAILTALLKRGDNAVESGMKSIVYPFKDRNSTRADMRLPLWTLSYWHLSVRIKEYQEVWSNVQEWLNNRGSSAFVYSMLNPIPWQYTLPPPNWGNTQDLARYLSDRWLSDVQICPMVGIVQSELSLEGTVRVEDVYLAHTLIAEYHEKDKEGHLKRKNITRLGEALKNGTATQLVFPVFVCLTPGSAVLPSRGENPGNHWVAIAIDITTHSISHGDSLRIPPPTELSDILIWWMNRLFPEQPFEMRALPCGSRSCTVRQS